jgi:hypothetical protein
MKKKTLHKYTGMYVRSYMYVWIYMHGGEPVDSSLNLETLQEHDLFSYHTTTPQTMGVTETAEVKINSIWSATQRNQCKIGKNGRSFVDG